MLVTVAVLIRAPVEPSWIPFLAEGLSFKCREGHFFHCSSYPLFSKTCLFKDRLKSRFYFLAADRKLFLKHTGCPAWLTGMIKPHCLYPAIRHVRNACVSETVPGLFSAFFSPSLWGARQQLEGRAVFPGPGVETLENGFVLAGPQT